MAREKKISLKYFLNHRLIPQKGKDGSDKYPVYIRITFFRKQTNVKLSLPGIDTLYWDEPTLSEFLDRRETGNLNSTEIRIVKQEEILREVIRRRYHKQKDKFTFEGIGEEMEYHFEKVLALLHESTSSLLDNELKVLLPPGQYEVVKNADLADKYFAATALSIGLKDQLSESLQMMIKSFASFCAFDASRLKSTTIYSWYNEGDKEAYNLFAKQLINSDKVRENILSKSQVDNNMRLLSNFIEDLPKANTLVDVIDNQILAARP